MERLTNDIEKSNETFVYVKINHEWYLKYKNRTQLVVCCLKHEKVCTFELECINIINIETAFLESLLGEVMFERQCDDFYGVLVVLI